jgi:hypothetical protein
MLPKKTINTERLELRFGDIESDPKLNNGRLDKFYLDYRDIYLKNSDTKVGIIYLKKGNELCIFLESQYQRSGIGTEVCYTYLREIFSKTDIEKVNTVVLQSNLESIAFHKKLKVLILDEGNEIIRYLITKDQLMEKVKEFNDKKVNPNVALDCFGKDIGEIFK